MIYNHIISFHPDEDAFPYESLKILFSYHPREFFLSKHHLWFAHLLRIVYIRTVIF